MDKNENLQKGSDPLPPAAVLPAATCSHSGRISIADYYELPLWERWPAMRENWMEKLLQDKGLGDCVIECAMRDLLDALHRERAANENLEVCDCRGKTQPTDTDAK